jgi:hypothetical protein
MHGMKSGTVDVSHDQLAWLGRCNKEEAVAAARELLNNKVADGRVDDARVTLICRRLEKDAKDRKSHQKRQLRYREKLGSGADGADLTPERREDDAPSSNSSSIQDQQKQQKYTSVAETPPYWSRESGWVVCKSMRDSWRQSFPDYDLDQQLAAMDAWLRVNADRPEGENWGRFAVNWLLRERKNDKESGRAARRNGRTRPSTAAADRAEKPHRERCEGGLSIPVRRYE